MNKKCRIRLSLNAFGPLAKKTLRLMTFKSEHIGNDRQFAPSFLEELRWGQGRKKKPTSPVLALVFRIGRWGHSESKGQTLTPYPSFPPLFPLPTALLSTLLTAQPNSLWLIIPSQRGHGLLQTTDSWSIIQRASGLHSSLLRPREGKWPTHPSILVGGSDRRRIMVSCFSNGALSALLP